MDLPFADGLGRGVQFKKEIFKIASGWRSGVRHLGHFRDLREWFVCRFVSYGKFGKELIAVPIDKGPDCGRFVQCEPMQERRATCL